MYSRSLGQSRGEVLGYRDTVCNLLCYVFICCEHRQLYNIITRYSSLESIAVTQVAPVMRPRVSIFLLVKGMIEDSIIANGTCSVGPMRSYLNQLRGY